MARFTTESVTLRTECLSELLGTYLLVLIGPATVVLASQDQSLSGFAMFGLIALSFGGTVGVDMLLLGKYSSQVDPAVSLAESIVHPEMRRKLLPIIAAQLLGGILSGATLRAMFPLDSSFLGSTRLASGVSPSMGLILEAFATMSLTLAALFVGKYLKQSAWRALLVGTVVFGMIMLVGPYTCASMNPARSLGPSLFSGYSNNQYVYWVGPFTGAALGAVIFRGAVHFRRQIAMSAPTG